MSVLTLFDRGAEHYPNRACLVQGAATLPYWRIRERTYRTAGALRQSGLEAGHKVAIYTPNCSQAYEAMLGIYRAGGVFVPANAKAHVSENVYILNLCDVQALFYHSSLAKEIEVIRAECPGVRTFICLDSQAPGSVSFEEWIAASEPLSSEVPRSRDELVSIYSTGGTTGRPKGVMFSSATWNTVAANFLSSIPNPREPVFLLVAPMTHGAGTSSFVLLPLGVTIVIQDHFDAGEVMAAIQRHAVTHLFLPPTAIYMMLAHPQVSNFDYSSLRCFLYAGAPMSVDKLKVALEVFGPVMMQSYGQTEAPMFCTALTPEEHREAIESTDRRLASCGRSMLLTSVEIMDDEGRILPAQERGEIVVRGDLVMLGYYKNAAATEEASKFGWHHTGDIGLKDDDGYIFIVDRKKDMIITGGFNVYPTEVEQVIWSHPAVQECAVIGVPDDKWGEAIKAVIELKPSSHVAPEEIIAMCKARLGSVKAPKTVEIWAELPRTPVGKVSKREIRAQFWRDHERAI